MGGERMDGLSPAILHPPLPSSHAPEKGKTMAATDGVARLQSQSKSSMPCTARCCMPYTMDRVPGWKSEELATSAEGGGGSG